MARPATEEIETKINTDPGLAKLFQEAVEASRRPLKKWEKLKSFFYEAANAFKKPRKQFAVAKDPVKSVNEFGRRLEAGETMILSKEESDRRFAELYQGINDLQKKLVLCDVVFALEDHPDAPFEFVARRELTRQISRHKPNP